jgi:hypothetical protein
MAGNSAGKLGATIAAVSPAEPSRLRTASVLLITRFAF